MKDDKDAVLQRAAESIADGVPFSWDPSKEGDGKVKERIRRLRVLQSIAEVHRSPEADSGRVPTDISDLTTINAERRPAPLFRWGHLEVIELIGHGGFGEIYRAYDPTLQKEVALKLLRQEGGPDESRRKRFLAEARRLARIRHENVLVVHGAAEHDGRVGLWTDLVEGETLESLLEQQGPFGAQEAAGMAITLCRALAAIHAGGLVHRDVKLSNVMREKGGRYVLLDFSSATESAGLEGASEAATISGTPLYMAPEVFRGEDSGVAADVYSLGVVLYRLVSARYPVEAKKLSELRHKHLQGESRPLRDARPDLPDPYIQVVERALEPDPAKRFRSMGEMERALRFEGSKGRRLKFLLAAAAVLIVGAMLSPLIPPRPLQVEASLYRTGEGTEERLLPGGKLTPGDLLFLEIEGSHSMYVYVMNEDTEGRSVVLFPLPELKIQNPLPPGTRHRLPGAVSGVPQRWAVTTAGGEETFIVIASLEQLTDMEHEIEKIPRAGSEAAIELNEESIGVLRGIGGLKPFPEGGPLPRRPLTGIFASLSKESAKKSGLWIWEIRLENPGPPGASEIEGP